jgi:hypothetical protein
MKGRRAGVRILTGVAVLVAAGLCFGEDDETLQVIDIEYVTTNRVALGTNLMSLAAATNVIARHRDTVDAIAFHGPIEKGASEITTSSAALEIARAGVPLMIVEKDGAYAWREQSGADGIRTIKIGTDQFEILRRIMPGGKNGSDNAPRPVVQTTVELDPDAGLYELKRIELGLLGERVWLMHEQREDGEESGTIGIQFRTEW